MYNGLITACDSCAHPLEGRVGTADIKLPHLVIKGNLASVAIDKDKYPDGYMFWAKKRDDMSQLHFCNEKCLGAYMSAKIYLITQNWDGDRTQLDKKQFDW